MGMTIDECIDYFLRSYAIDDTDDARQHNETLETTIDTLRKYQKVKNIICKWEDGLYDDEALLDCEVLEKISDEINGSGENADASNNN